MSRPHPYGLEIARRLQLLATGSLDDPRTIGDQTNATARSRTLWLLRDHSVSQHKRALIELQSYLSSTECKHGSLGFMLQWQSPTNLPPPPENAIPFRTKAVERLATRWLLNCRSVLHVAQPLRKTTIRHVLKALRKSVSRRTNHHAIIISNLPQGLP